MSEEIAEVVVEGLPDYDRYVWAVNNAIVFRGKTIEEWTTEIDLPDLPDNTSPEDIKSYSYYYVNKSKIITNNLAFAKSAFKACEMQYNVLLMSKKAAIIAAIEGGSDTKKRVPGVDSLNERASLECRGAFIAMNIAEIFLNFWQSHFDRVRIMDSRLTSMGYVLGSEQRHKEHV